MVPLLFRKHFDFLGTAQIKTSPTWAAILTYFHLFHNEELLYLNLSHILAQQLTTEVDLHLRSSILLNATVAP